MPTRSFIFLETTFCAPWQYLAFENVNETGTQRCRQLILLIAQQVSQKLEVAASGEPYGSLYVIIEKSRGWLSWHQRLPRIGSTLAVLAPTMAASRSSQSSNAWRFSLA
jgi:hypothetical protein